MKYFRIIVFLPLLMAFQCEDDIEIADDNLNDSGLLGTWEIADETVNGISDMLPICCEFFEFNPDDNKQDFTGLFVYTDSMGDVYDGLFTVDQTNQTLLFEWDDEQITYGYELDSSQEHLTFTFTEDNLNYVQGWVKID